MDHADHLNLLRPGIPARGGVWADLGAGAGAFTLALIELLGAEAEVYAVDRDARSLRSNAESVRTQFPQARVMYTVADFTGALSLPSLDGIVMANSLHFQSDQPAVVQRLRQHLRPGGRMLVVEYNISRANFAVPYPLPYRRWEAIAHESGFEHTDMVSHRPSRTLREIYAAASW